MYFLQNPSLGLDEPNNYKNSQVFLSCVNARHVVIINTKNDSIGRVALILIGMGEISACVSKIKEGDAVEKGQCIGRFEFGGSSHVIVFDRRANL
jgi:phosphatidylserine decarboxylase